MSPYYDYREEKNMSAEVVGFFATKTFVAGMTAGILSSVIGCTDITTGWLSMLLFAGGVANVWPTSGVSMPPHAYTVRGEKPPPRVLSLFDSARVWCAALSMIMPLPLFIADQYYKDDPVIAARQAQTQAIQNVLDGENRSDVSIPYPDHTVLRKWGEATTVTRSAKIISRTEPSGVGQPGQTELELVGVRHAYGAARMKFQLVKEETGGVSYYFLEPVENGLSFGNGTITHEQYRPVYWGSRTPHGPQTFSTKAVAPPFK